LEKEVGFTAVTGQYVRLMAVTEATGKAWTTAAEIDVLGGAVGGSFTNSRKALSGTSVSGCSME
jgi:hypothetical protein